MKTVLFLVLLLQSVYSQQDSLRKFYLNDSREHLKDQVQNIEQFFKPFIGETSLTAAALQLDTSAVYIFDVKFSTPLEYNVATKSIDVDFNYLVEDKNCSNSKRNGILLKEIVERTPSKKKEPEKIFKTVYLLIPYKCSTTRFYNEQGDLFCDNKRQFPLPYEEGIKAAGLMKVMVEMQLVAGSAVDVYDTVTPSEPSYPIETHLKEYVLRCSINSLALLKGDEIMDICVSLRK